MILHRSKPAPHASRISLFRWVCIVRRRSPDSRLGRSPRIFAVVINCPMCRCVCSAAWNSRPRTVLGSCAADTAHLGQRLVGRAQLRQRTLDRRVELREQPGHHLRPQSGCPSAASAAFCAAFSCSPRACVNRRSRLPAACRAWKPTEAAPPGVTQMSRRQSGERGVQLLARDCRSE